MSTMMKLGGLAVSGLLCMSLLSCARDENKEDAAMPAGPELKWLTSLDDARKEAAAKQRPILVDFSGSDWCGWCIRLDREVFSKAAFKTYAENNLVLLLLDFPRSKPQSAELKRVNQGLAEKFNIEGFPTILLLDADGRELARTGYRPGGAEAYVEHLKTLVKP